MFKSSFICPERIDSVVALKQLQSLMAEVLFRSLDENDGMLPTWKDGSETQAVVEGFITPNDRLTAFERLEIYNRQYWFRVLDVLHDDYPALRRLLGQKKFHAMSRAYLAAYPSETWTLRNLGSRLVRFLEAEPQLTTPKTQKAIEVARVEWAQTLAFDEPRLAPVQGDDLLSQDIGNLQLHLQPYLVLLELNHAVDVFVKAIKKQESGLRSEASNALSEAPQRGKAKRAPALKVEKVWLAVHRFENQIYFKRLEQESFTMLTAIRDGATLGEAVELALVEASPEVDWIAQIRAWFADWAALGWFCEISKDETTK